MTAKNSIPDFSSLRREFYERPTLEIASNLIGLHLMRQVDGLLLAGMIVECEAYIGESDSACHASKGRTRRTNIMYGPAGHAYIYFTYGMHWLLNIVTETEGFPAAILIRALQPLMGLEEMAKLRGGAIRSLTSGPARLCQALAIDGDLLGADMTDPLSGLWVTQGTPPTLTEICHGPRVGIRYAKKVDQQRPWRFWLKDNPYISAKKNRVKQ